MPATVRPLHRVADRAAVAKNSKQLEVKRKAIDFDLWVTKKDKYDKALELLSLIDVERANNDEQWMSLTKAMVATDCYLTGFMNIFTLNSASKSGCSNQDEEKEESEQKFSDDESQHVGRREGSDLDIFYPSSTQSRKSKDEKRDQEGHGYTPRPEDDRQEGGKVCTTPLTLMEILNAKPLRYHWLRWTMEHRTFSGVPLTENQYNAFDGGTKEGIEVRENPDTKEKTYTLQSVKIMKAVKPSKDDNERIRKRKALTKDQILLNAIFVQVCNRTWRECRQRILKELHDAVEKHFGEREEKSKNDADRSTRKSTVPALSLNQLREKKRKKALRLLTEMGIEQMAAWIEQDKEEIEKREKEAKMKDEQQSSSSHESYVKEKEFLRLRLPTIQELELAGMRTSSAKTHLSSLSESSMKPGRMDFSMKGRAKKLKPKIATSSVAMLLGSGLKYIHAQSHGTDFEKSKKQLAKQGFVFKENFKDETSEYIFEQRRVLQAAEQKRREDAQIQFRIWAEAKAAAEKALKLLPLIDKPSQLKEQARETAFFSNTAKTLSGERHSIRGGDRRRSRVLNSSRIVDSALLSFEDEAEVDAEADYLAEDHWIEVGSALKLVNPCLLSAWTTWSQPFRSVGQCRKQWATFAPVMDSTLKEVSEIREYLLQQLRQKNVDLKSEFWEFCIAKARKAIKRGLMDDKDIDSPEELPEKYRTISVKEFETLLSSFRVKIAATSIETLTKFVDSDSDGRIDIKEVLRFLDDPTIGRFRIKPATQSDGEEKLIPLSRNSKSTKREDEEHTGYSDDEMEREDGEERDKSLGKAAELSAVLTTTEILRGLKQLKIMAAVKKEESYLLKRIESGQPPGAPTLSRGVAVSGLDPTTEISLMWNPPNVVGENGPTFYILETSGAEGSRTHRQNEFKEICRDPESYDDNNGEPRYSHIISNLKPCTSYVFRLRAFNGFGAGPFVYLALSTAPATPPAPTLCRSSATSLYIQWANDESALEKIRQLKKLFEEADIDKNGSISRDELMNELERKHPHLLRFLHTTVIGKDGEGLNISVFDAIETDDNEQLSWEEFLSFFQGLEFDDDTAMELGIVGDGGLESPSVLSNNPGVGFPISSAMKKNKGLERNHTFSSKSNILVRKQQQERESRTKLKYILKRCLSDSKSEFEEVYRGSKPSAVLHGLQPATSYQFRVQAVSEDGQQSLHSEPLIVHTRLPTPDPPKLVGEPLSRSIKLRWRYECNDFVRNKSGGGSESRKGAHNKAAIDKVLREWTSQTRAERNSISTPEGEDEEELLDDTGLNVGKSFDQYDRDGSGTLDIAEFRQVLRDLGVHATPELLSDYIEEFDTDDKDGKISRREFLKWWKKSTVTYILKRDDGISEKVLRQMGPNALISLRPSPELSCNPSMGASFRHVCYRGKGTIVQIGGLEPNTLYRFRIQAVGSYSRSALGKELQIMTAPSPPTPAGLIELTSKMARLTWYPGRSALSASSRDNTKVSHPLDSLERGMDNEMGCNPPYRYAVQMRFIETLPSSSHPNADKSPNHGDLDGGEWKVIYDGSENKCTVTNLLSNSVYWVRVQAFNRLHVGGEFSDVSQAVTPSMQEDSQNPSVYKASCASLAFTVQCGRLSVGTDNGQRGFADRIQGGLVPGDTVLFQERLAMDPNNPRKFLVVTGTESLSKSGSSCSSPVSASGTRRPALSKYEKTEANDRLRASWNTSHSLLSLPNESRSKTSELKIVGKRTIAARVLSIAHSSQHSREVRMQVLWSSFLSAISSAGMASAIQDRRRSSSSSITVRSGSRSKTICGSSSNRLSSNSLTRENRIGSRQLLLSSRSSTGRSEHVLPDGVQIARSEDKMFVFEVFRARWVQEEARQEYKWRKIHKLDDRETGAAAAASVYDS